MPGEPKTKKVEPITKEILFQCKFCGQTKPFSELVVLRQYYPQLSACKDCAKGKPTTEQPE